MNVDPAVEEWFVLPVCFGRAMTPVSLSLLVWSAFPEKERSRSGLGARVLGAQWGRDSGRHLSINYCVMFTVHTHTHTHKHTCAHTHTQTHTHIDTHTHTVFRMVFLATWLAFISLETLCVYLLRSLKLHFSPGQQWSETYQEI